MWELQGLRNLISGLISPREIRFYPIGLLLLYNLSHRPGETIVIYARSARLETSRWENEAIYFLSIAHLDPRLGKKIPQFRTI